MDSPEEVEKLLQVLPPCSARHIIKSSTRIYFTFVQQFTSPTFVGQLPLLILILFQVDSPCSKEPAEEEEHDWLNFHQLILFSWEHDQGCPGPM